MTAAGQGVGLPLAEAADTERLGAALARSAPWSLPQPLVVYLHGDLGAGKTTLARGLLHALGVSGTVRSPSYTLLESYAVDDARLVLHLDLYRLSQADGLEDLGLRDEMEPGVMLLVEWPERAVRGLPAPDLQVRLNIIDEHRLALIESGSDAGKRWLATMRGAEPIQN